MYKKNPPTGLDVYDRGEVVIGVELGLKLETWPYSLVILQIQPNLL